MGNLCNVVNFTLYLLAYIAYTHVTFANRLIKASAEIF